MEKIREAMEYVLEEGVTDDNITTACGIYADCYEEYMTLYHYLSELKND